MAASNTRFTQNSLGQSKTPIDSDHGIYRYCELRGRSPSKFSVSGRRRCALPTISRFARAQAYPTRPVRILVGYAAGGPLDISARLIAQWLSERLGSNLSSRTGRARQAISRPKR